MNHLIYENAHTKWLDLLNPTEAELKAYSVQYNLDYYTLADCLEPNHLPKEEKLNDFTFIILRRYDKKVTTYPVSVQQMSNKIALFCSKDVLITVHRNPVFFLEEIREQYLQTERIFEPSEIVTKIMWYVIKSFEPIAVNLSEEIDSIERKVFLGQKTKITLEELYYLKNSCRLNKKVLLLTRDVIQEHLVIPRDKSAFQDVRDLLKKVSMSFEETYDDAASLSNTYLSIVSQKTNDVMKLLTIFSVFFMPLTFIAGIYGMNFDYMPELRYKMGYPITMIVMAVIALAIFIWFKRKNVL
jgi:magnesium transporter